MNAIDQTRALFVPGERVECVDNTYHRACGMLDFIGRVWTVGKVGKSVWTPTESQFRGTFPARVRDVVAVDDREATWLIGCDDHTVTYRRAQQDALSQEVR